jgi:hypothetical protein
LGRHRNKLDHATFHFERIGQSLRPTEQLPQNPALMDSIGASFDAFTWHREFYAHLDAFLSAARSVPEIIKRCFGVDRGNREMRAWFDSLNAAERRERRVSFRFRWRHRRRRKPVDQWMGRT